VQPQQILKSVVARRLMQSMGRVMAAYFSDGSVYVYSPDHQRHMPPLHRHQPSIGMSRYVYGHMIFHHISMHMSRYCSAAVADVG